MIEELNQESLHSRAALVRLDSVAADMETRWGIGRLEALAPADLQTKWQRQREKLDDAIFQNNTAAIPALVDGTVRGWHALEAAAKAAGHVPYWPDVWEYQIAGRLYRVVKCHADAQAAHRPDKKAYVVTIEEILRVFDARHAKTYNLEVLNTQQHPKLPKEFWENGGDNLDGI